MVPMLLFPEESATVVPVPALKLKAATKPLGVAEMLKVWALEIPPPGAGLNTVTWAVPGAATSEARIFAVNCVGETKLVTRSAPFQRTTELTIKLDPFTVRVNAAAPGGADAGLMLVVAGTGFVLVPPIGVFMSF